MSRLAALSLFFALMGCAPSLPSTGVPVRVAVDREASRVYEIPLEQYLVGVLQKEVLPDWPPEALKAQAVASRTYALYRRSHPRDGRFDIAADTSDQVFETRRRYPRSIVRAVRETEGEVLSFDGKIFEAFFHSCCGGSSERADRVWEGIETQPLLGVKEDPFCKACPRAHWEYEVTREDFAASMTAAGYPLKGDEKIEIAERDESGRVAQIVFHARPKKIRLSGTAFRQILGAANLHSTLFEIHEDDGRLVFDGRGSGHGVGLCQWGAKEMADEGKNYTDILEFYYPGAALVKTDNQTAPEAGEPDTPDFPPDPE